MQMRNTNNPKLWFRFGVLFVAFLAFISGSSIILNNFFSSNLKVPAENMLATPLQYSPLEIPVLLKIPTINVNAKIIPVGITNLGAMDTPKGPSDTGWFDLGPVPGEIGSAVIDGHRGFRTGPAVFDDLHKINVGDKIFVENKDGKNFMFVVREKKVYGANENVPDVWNKNDKAHLNLITCSGTWNRLTRTSNERLVVFTDLVD